MKAPLLLCIAAVAGCTASNDHRPQQTPSSATPGIVALTVSDFADTDKNGYRDTTTAAAYVYAESAAYPIPMRARGSFDFVLEGSDGARLAEWKFDEKQTAAAMHEMAPGPGFVFELSLLSLGSDRLAASDAQILCTFTPLDGRPVRARPSATLLVGPVGRTGTRG